MILESLFEGVKEREMDRFRQSASNRTQRAIVNELLDDLTDDPAYIGMCETRAALNEAKRKLILEESKNPVFAKALEDIAVVLLDLFPVQTPEQIKNMKVKP